MDGSRRETIVQVTGVLAGSGIILWALLAPPPEGFDGAMQSVLAVFATTLVLWLTKAVPYVVSATASVVLLFALDGVESFSAAASGFASTLVFFLLLLLLLGQSISKVGLDEWFASELLSTESQSPHPVRSLGKYTLVLSFVMPSAVARAVTFIPIVREMSNAYGLSHDSDFERASFLVLGHVNPIASMSLMTGGGMAIITSELIQNEVRPITWLEWATLMVPPVILLYSLSALTAERIYDSRSEITEASNDRNGQPNAQKHTVGSNTDFTRDQTIVGAVLFGTVLLWIIGSLVGLPTIVPAVFAIFVLALPGVDIITTTDVKELSWGILFVIGAMFSILDAMEATGTLTYIVNLLTSVVPFEILTHWQSIAVLLGLAVLMRVFFSTASAAIVVVTPIILRFGELLQVNQLYLALSVLLIVGSTTILPFNTTSVLLSFDRGPLSNVDVAVFGLVTMVYAAVVITISWTVYWPLII